MGTIKKIFKRYFIDAMGAMTLGLFASLIIGLIISQLAKIPGLSIISNLTELTGATSPVIGAAMGVAIAWGLKTKPLVMFTSAVTGAIGYIAGGPVGAYVAGVVGAEFGGLVAGRTKVDIVITPFTTIITGGTVGLLVGPYISNFMQWLGSAVNTATELSPIPMGIIVAVIVGLALTGPISSAALCIMIGINGIAAGAAVVGCACQMIGFAVASFRDNGWGGLISQGLGTSMLQLPNIMRRPQIWIAPTLAGAILGPISTAVLGMTNTSLGAGMGTSGLVGQFGTFDAMLESNGFVPTLIMVIAMHFVLPAVLTLAFDFILRKIGWVKAGDMKLADGK
ncbi:MAG: PTS sugar transporter subunit IIC [Oscillospiraceae bacterium]|nr:PTS sugar transporter subunit IIC [Oscillospiraceae bacterium]